MALPKSTCDNCVNTECLWRAPTGGLDPPVMICPNKIEKPKTNADHIRSMTDEELAEWISCNCVGDGYGNGVEDWLEWLKGETKDVG